jgi:hypothetical protein
VGDEPPNGPPCAPDAVPEAPCPTPGVACDPGPSCNALLVCSVNELAIACPISRRAAKDDIDYLDDAAARRVHDALLRYPLATWRYKTAPDDARHLGFIIDDVAPSPAVAPDGAHVDLYGYTSMAVAALQVQAKEIAALRAEVAALRQALPAVRAAAGKSTAAASSAPRRSARSRPSSEGPTRTTAARRRA